MAWTPACGAADHNVVYGPLAYVGTHGYSGQECGIGTSGSYDQLTPGPGSWFFLVVGTDGSSVEGAHGTDASGQERPEQHGDPVCTFARDLQYRCD